MPLDVSPLGAARTRYNRLRTRVGRIVPSNYDDRCNLTCEGFLHFEGEDRLAHVDGDGDWKVFFAEEARRGVNFAYLAGASTAQDNLVLSRSDFARAREQIARALEAFPGAIVY